MTGHELIVVIPVHNEAECVAEVIRSWAEALRQLNIEHLIRVYDDGSLDKSAAIVQEVMREVPSVELVQHERRGHGPTILRGYREATGNWILQVDGDGEVRPTEFPTFWRNRDAHDLVLGVRHGRRSPPSRRLISILARLVVFVTFGRVLRDVNCPYRLMRRKQFESLLSLLPANTFAPNVVLSAMAHASRLSVLEVPIQCHARAGGGSTLRRMRLLGATLRALWQTGYIASRFWIHRFRIRVLNRNGS